MNTSRTFLAILLACISLSMASPAHSQAVGGVIERGVGGSILRKLVPGVGGAMAGAGAYGLYKGYRHGQQGKASIAAYVADALHNFGTIEGTESLQVARIELEKHLIVGKRAATETLAIEVAQDPSLDPAARQIITTLGLNEQLYTSYMSKTGTVVSKSVEAQAAASAQIDEDEFCQESDPDDGNPTAKKKRNTPGFAYGGDSLRIVTQGTKWWYGTHGNIARMPKQIAISMRGKRFGNWDALRKAIWTYIGNDPVLNNGFSKSNVKTMEKGNAPIALPSQWLGARDSYEIHHMTPISQGGGVYDFDNFLIVTPRCHKEILDDDYHRGD
jgi:hypothetical protein